MIMKNIQTKIMGHSRVFMKLLQCHERPGKTWVKSQIEEDKGNKIKYKCLGEG